MKREEINIRDPFVLTRNGQYYLYGTRGATCWGPADGFDVYVSRDLENWDGPFECFHNDGTFWADRNYWAPEVHEYHGKLYMLASFKREDLCRGTAILTADDPLGPFVPHSDGRVTPSNWECLDGTLYVSPDDKPYLVFAHEWVQVGDGEICAMPLSDDLSRAIGEPKLLFHASEAEWARLVHHRSSGRDGYVTDGPSMWRTADGTLLCLWASFSDEGYTEGVAVSDNGDITGHFTQVEPLFRRDGGHGMVFRALDGQLYLTLHSPNEHLKEHPCFIPLEEIAGRLTPKYTLPDWFAPLQSRLHKMADELTASLTGWHGSDATFRPEDFGLVPSEKATRAIQSAIDKAGEHGGTVRLSGGDYVSGTLILRSNVRLMVDSGSRLLASTDLADYPEQIARRLTVQDTNMGMNQSLIFAEGCENICICGGGELDGQGTRANFPGDETCHGTPGRPFLMRIVDCRDVHVHDITLRSAACWMVMRADGSITTSRFTKSMKSASTSVSYASPRRPATTPNSIDVFAVRTARIARTRAFHEMSFDAQPPGCFSSGISRVTGGGHSKSPFSLNIDAFTGSSAFSMHCGIFPSSFVMSATPHDPPPPPPKCSRFPKKWRCVWKSGLPQPSS